MNLLFAINHNFTELLCGCLTSVLKTGGFGHYSVYILHSDLTDEEMPASGEFECVVAVRPEQVTISREPVEGAIPVSIYASQPAGSETIVTLKGEKDEFLVKEIGQAHYAIDQNVWAIIDPKKINVYNKSTTRLIKRVVD